MAKVVGLTPRQRQFIEEYAISYNAKEAYFKVYGGTSKQHPYDVLHKPEAQEYLKQLQQEEISKWGEKADVILAALLDDALIIDEEGKHSPTWLKSIELAQKQLGLQNQKVDLNSKQEVIINILGEDNEA